MMNSLEMNKINKMFTEKFYIFIPGANSLHMTDYSMEIVTSFPKCPTPSPR